MVALMDNCWDVETVHWTVALKDTQMGSHWEQLSADPKDASSDVYSGSL